MNIGALALTLKWIAKGRGKTPVQIAGISPAVGHDPGNLGKSEGGHLTWGQIMKGSVLIEKGLCFETNISKDVFAIIGEAELMEQLGFVLDPTIRSAAEQKDRLHRDLEAVQKVISDYNTIAESLTTAQARILMN
jgi:hypothetical protein